MAIVIYCAWAIFKGQRSAYAGPRNSAANAAAADTSALSGGDDPASVLAHRAIADYPAEPVLWQTAAEELTLTNPAAARKIFLFASEAQPGTAPAGLLEDCAAACIATDDASGALEQTGRLSVPDSARVRARYLRSAAQLELGGPPDASDAGSPGGTEEFVYSAARLLAPVKYSSEHAITVIEHFGAAAGPLQREALRVLARRRAQPDPGEALASAERAAEGSPDTADWRYFSQALRQAGRDPGASDNELERLGGLDPAAALDYTAWLMVRHRSSDAFDWLVHLPEPMQEDARLRERRAVLLAALGDEDPLKAALLSGSWGRINPDAVEFAFSARLAAEHGENSLRRNLWGQALAAAGNHGASVRILIRLAMDWRWPEETARAFAALLQHAPADVDAAREYLAWAHRENNTAQWQQAALAWRQADPDSGEAKITWAHLALVRGDPGTQAEAVAIAEQLAQSDPGQLPLLALARHQQHRDEEAIAILEKLPLEQLTRPHAALYYGILLAAVEPARASRYLDYAARGDDLLPEERVWLKQARMAAGGPAFDNSTP